MASVWIALTDGYANCYTGTRGRVFAQEDPELLKIHGVYDSELACLRECVQHQGWKCAEYQITQESESMYGI